MPVPVVATPVSPPQRPQLPRVKFVVFLNTQKIIASCHEDNTIKLWEMESSQELANFKGYVNRVTSAALSPDGRLLVFGDEKGRVQLREIPSGRDIWSTPWVDLYGGSATDLAFSPNGKSIAAALGKRVRFCDVSMHREGITLTDNDDVWSIVFSPDGKMLASGGKGKSVTLWDITPGLKLGRKVCTFRGHTHPVSSIAFSADGHLIASGGDDKVVKLWDVATRREVRTLEAHAGRVTCIAFSVDGRYLASGSDDKTVKLWDASSGREIRTITGHNGPILSLAFSQDGAALASASKDGTVRLWGINQDLIHEHITQLVQAVADTQFWYNRCLEQIKQEQQRRVTEIDAHYQQALAEAKSVYETAISKATEDIDSFIQSLGLVASPWDDSHWRTWRPPLGDNIPSIIRVGQWLVEGYRQFFNVPAFIPFIGTRNVLLKASGSAKSAAVYAIQSILQRLLANIPPSKLRFTFIDPIGLGQNVAPFMHLADYDETLVTGKAWTEPQHIEQRLADLTEHMENVIQKYLRNQFATIEEYNAQAGEVAEPYRVLVVFDFPINFSEAAAHRLVSIAQNGPRCGVHAIVLADTEKPLPYGFNVGELEQTSTVIAWDGSRFVWQDPDFQESPLLLSELLASSEITIEQPYLLITDYKITEWSEILPILEKLVQQSERCLAVIASDMEGEALRTLELNISRGIFKSFAAKVPGPEKHRKEILHDIAILTGGNLITAQMGRRLDTAQVSDLGRADKVVATKTRIVVWGGKSDANALKKRLDDIKVQLQEATSDYDRAQLRRRLDTLTSGGAMFEVRAGDCLLELDTPPGAELFTRIITTVGEAAKEASKVEVPFERIAPRQEQWWTSDSHTGLQIPLGPAGAHKVQNLDLGKGTAQHALVAGKTGAGKSTLLHTLITNLSLTYSPEEVELYLIDFKKGVEFKTYAVHQLPHARVVAIESEREFGLSVLQGLDAELKRRGNLFRAAAVDHIADYRQKKGERMPRILLLVDEFQEFFTEDDAIASQSSQILDRLVRQGRAFGIHVLLGSQTLAGAYTLARSTIDQMAVRIALQCSEADSRLILADDNPAARLLSRPGEAIYNAANGMVEGNNRFQVAWLPDDQRDRYLAQVQALAEKRGYRPPQPQIVFEGNAPAEVEKNRALYDLLTSPTPPVPSRTLRAWLGEPIAIRESVAANFRRQSGSNLLIVGQNDEAALGMMTVALISLVAQLPPPTGRSEDNVYVLDFGAVDAPYADFFTHLAEQMLHPIKIGRRRQLPEIVNELETEVQRRIDADEASVPPKYLFLYGLQRARDLRQEESFGFPLLSSGEPTAPNPAQQFTTILREGPDVGVHTVVWCDTLTNLNRSLDRRVLREFTMRAVFQMSAEDSANLIDTPAASKLGLYRALFYSEEEGRLEKFRPYALPAAEWLTWVGEQIQRKGAGT